MAATVNFDVKLSNAHALDSFPGPRADGLIGSELLDLARCGVGPEAQIAPPCPGFPQLASGGAMPGEAHCYKRYRTNQCNWFHKRTFRPDNSGCVQQFLMSLLIVSKFIL